jgi:pimeloyl-ACP methyl ester carboxylesterase
MAALWLPADECRCKVTKERNMPKASVNGCLYNYADQGKGSQVIFFGHGLMYTWQSFEHQIDHFARKGYRVIAIDWRGQGESEGSGDQEAYDLYHLGDDAYTLLESLSISRVHWVGLSMGGMVAMRLYPRHPELFQSLSLIDTSAADDPEHLPMYRVMDETYLAHGAVPPILAGLDGTFYTPAFPEKNPAVVERWHAYWATERDRRAMYNAVMPVIDRDDVSETVHAIAVPTLILCGDQDVSTPPDKSEDLHRRIQGSRYVVIPQSGHMSCVEQPEAVTRALDDFLSSLSAS